MKFNKQQDTYMKAKASLEALQEMEKEAEAEYVKGLGVTNPDGSVPEYTWAIDDDEIANKAIDDFAKVIEESGLWDKILAAKEELQKAEDDLIAFALAVMPQGKDRTVLESAVKTNYTVREKIIDAAAHLDISTITA